MSFQWIHHCIIIQNIVLLLVFWYTKNDVVQFSVCMLDRGVHLTHAHLVGMGLGFTDFVMQMMNWLKQAFLFFYEKYTILYLISFFSSESEKQEI